VKRYWPYLVGLAFAVAFACLTSGHYLFGEDSAHYVGLAQRLARGLPYQTAGRPELVYPPGFPALLAPAALLFHGRLAGIFRWYGFLAGLNFVVVWRLFRAYHVPCAAAIAAATMCCAGYLDVALRNPLSEPAFLAWSLLFLLWVDRQRDATSLPLGSAVLGAALLVLTVLTRTVGAAALAAPACVVAARCYRTRSVDRVSRRLALVGLVGFASLAVWMAWTAARRRPLYPGEYWTSYFAQMRLINPRSPLLGSVGVAGILARFGHNIVAHSGHLAELLTQVNAVQWIPFSPLILLPALLVAVGWWWHLSHGSIALASYAAAYALIILSWPFDQGTRFVLPVLPLAIVLAWDGARLGVSLLRRRPPRRAWLAICAVMAVVSLLGVHAGSHSLQARAAVVGWLVLAALGWAAHRPVVESLARRWKALAVGAAVAAYAAAGLAGELPLIRHNLAGTPLLTPYEVAVDSAAQWISRSTSDSASIMTGSGDRLAFVTGRPTIPLPVTYDTSVMASVVRRFHPEYVVVFDQDDGYFQPTEPQRFGALAQLFAERPDSVYRAPGVGIFRLPPLEAGGR